MVYENSKFKIEPVVLKQGKRSIVARLTSGLIRYVTDGLGKDETVTIETPEATIGIRGSDGEVLYLPSDIKAELGMPQEKILLAGPLPIRSHLNGYSETTVKKGTANVSFVNGGTYLVNAGQTLLSTPAGVSIKIAVATAIVAAAIGTDNQLPTIAGPLDLSTTQGTEKKDGGTGACTHGVFGTADGGVTSSQRIVPCGACPPDTNCGLLPAQELSHNIVEGCC